jgi:dihydrofolate reductase
MIAMIVACSENLVIGREGGLPWHLPDDLRHFMNSTLACPVIMGRKTFASLNDPLPRRINIVIPRTMTDPDESVVIVDSLDSAIDYAQTLVEGSDTPIWIAGGGEIYRQAMPIADQIVRTLVHETVQGDTVFPELDPSDWTLDRSEHHPVDDRHPHAFTIEWWNRATRPSHPQK